MRCCNRNCKQGVDSDQSLGEMSHADLETFFFFFCFIAGSPNRVYHAPDVQ